MVHVNKQTLESSQWFTLGEIDVLQSKTVWRETKDSISIFIKFMSEN